VALGSAGSDRPWQVRLLAELSQRVGCVEEVAELWVLGSARDPRGLDRWSDLDVGLVLAGDVPLELLLGPQDAAWAVDRRSDGDRATCRLVFTDGRRLDLVCAQSEDLAAAGGRLLSSTGGQPGGSGRVLADPVADGAVNEFRFVAAQAMTKLGRGDLLIGSHLFLELARLCLVQAMLLRDRDEAMTRHRFGTVRDVLAAEVQQIVRSAEPVPQAAQVEGLAALFDRLHAELHPTYRADWSGLHPPVGFPR
jgi:hypothetical protein